ncbi:MAG: M20 family metallopeptidase [Nitrososphaerales archaeon]
MTENQRVLALLQGHQDDMVADLAHLVEMESPSDDKASLDRLGEHLAGRLRHLGGQVEVLQQERNGNHLRGRWGQGERGGCLLLCHMDTVWDLGTVAERAVHVEEGKLYGPGAFDMKGGIVNALWAIRALHALELMPERRITLMITSDEEVGSRSSRHIIEAEAVQHDAVFVLEPAQPPHAALKTWRKGVGLYKVRVTGVSAHAGVAQKEGVNAIVELAHQVLAIEQLADHALGTTLNVGVIGGGTRSNVVPQHAWARVDARVMNQAEAERLDAALHRLQPHLKGAQVEVTGGINRPPMVRSEAGVALFRKAEAIAAELGFAVTESGTGGGSDGNFTAALGVPTLDGLGVAGDGGHALHEHVIISSLPERAALLAGLLRGEP